MTRARAGVAMGLRGLQRTFAAALLQPRGPMAKALRARLARRGPVGRQRPAFGPDARIGVYAHAYSARLVDVLAGDYAALRVHLGEDAFAVLARRYLAVHPSRHPNLNQLGARFPAFLKRRRAPAFACELARLELALTRAFDAAEFTPLPAAKLAALSPSRWQKATLLVNPSVQVMSVSAAVVDFHAAWRRGDPLPAPATLRRGRVHLCVFRADDQLGRRELPHAAAQLLRALARGQPLASAVARVPPGSPVDAWFAQWRADGVFTGVH